MRIQALRTTQMARALCLLTSLITFASSVSGQVNSWITPESGAWDQPASWSLGVLPNSSQSVQITNYGWKAVSIDPQTPVNYPDSMTVGSLRIRGASDTENVLLLNYFGTSVPLTVLNGVTLQDNAQIVNFNSGLVVQGGTVLIVNSQIIQNGGLVQTMNAPINFINGEYDLTNGVFNAGQVILGDYSPGRFNQYNGAVLITNLVFTVGTVSGAAGNGTYSLYGGYLSLPGGLNVTCDTDAQSAYFQSGGTNQTTQVLVEPGLEGHTPFFTLNGGVLADSGVNLFADNWATANIMQNGGTHAISNVLVIAGAAANSSIVHPATYSLNGGALSARIIELNADQGDSVFVQSNGTATAETVYAHSVGYYSSHNTTVTLADGTLSCSNYTTIDGGGTLNQSGGALLVSNLLDFGGSRDVGTTIYGRYTFTGGTLTASNINITGDWVIGDSSISRITNPGTISLSHALHIGNAVEQLGRFILPTNALVDLAGSSSRLSFANSSAEAWAGAATLVISNWNGAPSGGGAEQLKFGTSQSGLTPAQLSQIRFSLGSDLYTAKILSTGEVIPGQLVPPSIPFSRQGNNLVLTWPSGWSLQSATNVLGPYFDIPGATSPYTVDTTLSPRQFFRLRQ